MRSIQHAPTLLLILAMMITTGPAQAETAPAEAAPTEFGPALRAALDIHEKSSSLEEQAKALEAFRKTVERHPGRWLAHFWTAYEETQIAMLRKRAKPEADFNDYLERAQNHLAKAQELHTSATDRERSSFAVLQGLIYRFHAWFDEAEEESWSARSAQAVQTGAKIDPDNPTVLVMLATELTNRGRQDKDYILLLAGIQLMNRVQHELEAVPDRSETTYFNSEWIQFWLPGAEEAIAELHEAN